MANHSVSNVDFHLADAPDWEYDNNSHNDLHDECYNNLMSLAVRGKATVLECRQPMAPLRNSINDSGGTPNTYPHPTRSAGQISEAPRKASVRRFIPQTSDGDRTVRQYLCQACNTSFTKNKSLLRHQRTVHNDAVAVLRHKCELCDADFTRKDDRDRHMKYQHDAVKMECIVCGKEVSERALMNHWRTALCKAAQAASDAERNKELQQRLNSESVLKSYEFDSASLTNIWIVSAELFGVYWAFKPMKTGRSSQTLELERTYLAMRGHALRTMKQCVENCSLTTARELMASLAVFIFVSDRETWSESPAQSWTIMRYIAEAYFTGHEEFTYTWKPSAWRTIPTDPLSDEPQSRGKALEFVFDYWFPNWTFTPPRENGGLGRDLVRRGSAYAARIVPLPRRKHADASQPRTTLMQIANARVANDL